MDFVALEERGQLASVYQVFQLRSFKFVSVSLLDVLNQKKNGAVKNFTSVRSCLPVLEIQQFLSRTNSSRNTSLGNSSFLAVGELDITACGEEEVALLISLWRHRSRFRKEY